MTRPRSFLQEGETLDSNDFSKQITSEAILLSQNHSSVTAPKNTQEPSNYLLELTSDLLKFGKNINCIDNGIHTSTHTLIPDRQNCSNEPSYTENTSARSHNWKEEKEERKEC